MVKTKTAAMLKGLMLASNILLLLKLSSIPTSHHKPSKTYPLSSNYCVPNMPANSTPSTSLQQDVIQLFHFPPAGINRRLARNIQKVDSARATLCCMLLLLGLSNDINPNPGPIKSPCGLCSKPVKWNQRAVCCDNCDLWYHIRCI